MVYGACPMFSGSGVFYLNFIVGAIIFSVIFWGIYYLLTKNKEIKKRKRK